MALLVDGAFLERVRGYCIKVARPFNGTIDEDDVYDCALEVIALHVRRGGSDRDFWRHFYRRLVDQLRSQYGRRGESRYEGHRSETPYDPTLEQGRGDPTSDEVLALDTLDQLLRWCDARDERIVMLRLDEWTLSDIASEVGLTEARVWQVLRALREHVS